MKSHKCKYTLFTVQYSLTEDNLQEPYTICTWVKKWKNKWLGYTNCYKNGCKNIQKTRNFIIPLESAFQFELILEIGL